MKIEILDKSRYREYEDFLLSHEHSLFYHSTKYKDFLEELLECESHYLLAYDNEKIVAALPLMIKDGPLGKVVNSLPYYGSNGGPISSCYNAIEYLLNEYEIFIKNNNIISATLIENPLSAYKIKPLHNMTDQRIGQLTVFDKDQKYKEDILNLVESNGRRNIRYAQKNNITVVEKNSDINFIQFVHELEMKKNNRKFKNNIFFNKIKNYFVPGIDFKIFIAYRDSHPIGGLLMFYFNNIAEYFTPVVLEEERFFQSTPLILNYAMTDAVKRGFKWFNWGGTWLSQEGVYKFKKKFGAKDFLYNYYTYISETKIFNYTPEEILEMYPDFYVYNFNNSNILK